MKLLPAMFVITILIGSQANADVVRYTNFALWQSAVDNDYAEIDFLGWPQFTQLTDQYSHLGVIFVDGDDVAWQNQIFTGGAGLRSNTGVLPLGTGLSFTEPTYTIGFDIIGTLQVTLYWNDEVVYSSDNFSDAISTFGGLVSSTPFDSARLVRLSEASIVVDNLYFGPQVPAPGALGFFALAALTPRRRSNC
jgi:hypothetical protein